MSEAGQSDPITSEPAGSGPIRVLIVDDHAIVRKGIRALLATEPGINVVGEAENGHEAIAQAAAIQPDVILMDIVMPGMDGLEATRLICERYADKSVRPHIVGVSAFNDELTRDRGRAAGMAAFLGKPIRPDDLFAAVEQQTPEATEVGTEPEAEVAAG